MVSLASTRFKSIPPPRWRLSLSKSFALDSAKHVCVWNHPMPYQLTWFLDRGIVGCFCSAEHRCSLFSLNSRKACVRHFNYSDSNASIKGQQIKYSCLMSGKTKSLESIEQAGCLRIGIPVKLSGPLPLPGTQAWTRQGQTPTSTQAASWRTFFSVSTSTSLHSILTNLYSLSNREISSKVSKYVLLHFLYIPGYHVNLYITLRMKAFCYFKRS